LDPNSFEAELSPIWGFIIMPTKEKPVEILEENGDEDQCNKNIKKKFN
jgi:hypothetical protein